MSAKAPNKKAFTIVELLTVMGVIAILIGLLVPALGLVRDYAKEIQQKAQFHTIQTGLEMFNNDFGEYPESYENIYRHTNAFSPYGGAQKLAEAMVGLDFLGFHPNSEFRADNSFVTDDPFEPGTQTDPYPVYHAENPYNYAHSGRVLETADENVKARKGPYIDLEHANAYRMEDVYESLDAGGMSFYEGDPTSDTDLSTVVLCDVFSKKRASAQKTGMPILYFRANKQFTEQDSVTDTAGGAATYDDDIYNLDDNNFTLQLGTTDGTIDHPLIIDSKGTSTEYGLDDASLEIFDKMIVNPKVTAISRPFRAESYILISAGKDGLFGTPDDIFNFTKEE